MFYVYMLASGRNSTLYVGQTDNLARRVLQHKSKNICGFTAIRGVDHLVWFETFEFRPNAFRRERRIKEWRRSWKIMLIEAENPTWRDLYDELNVLLPL